MVMVVVPWQEGNLAAAADKAAGDACVASSEATNDASYSTHCVCVFLRVYSNGTSTGSSSSSSAGGSGGQTPHPHPLPMPVV